MAREVPRSRSESAKRMRERKGQRGGMQSLRRHHHHQTGGREKTSGIVKAKRQLSRNQIKQELIGGGSSGNGSSLFGNPR